MRGPRVESDAMATTGEIQGSEPGKIAKDGQAAEVPLAHLASLFSCSKAALRDLFDGPLVGRVRTVHGDPRMYDLQDAQRELEPYRDELQAKRQRHIDLEANNRAAALAAKEARIAADTKRKAEATKRPQGSRQGNVEPSSPATSPKPSGEKWAKNNVPPTSSRRQTSAPEVIVLPRRPSVRPPP
jgi:hypothetical protein